MAPLIRDLAIILGVAGLISLLFQRIRQPVVLGYILAGILIGPYTPPFKLITDIPSIKTWAELGVIFLMFTLGLEFSFRKLVRVGGSSAITAGMEILFFIPVGFIMAQIFGWSSMDGVFLGAMLSISSTTIIIKALDELKLKKHRFAELILAVLIVEDLFAILLLVALGTIAVSHRISALPLLNATAQLILVVGGWFLTGYFLVPRFMRYVGRVGDDEMLTILSLGLCLALVVFANSFNYSMALGAFIMGSIIAESPVLSRVESSMASLRSLFGAIFFVSIGMLIDPEVLKSHLGAVIVISLMTIVGKILSTTFGSLISGQSLRNSIQVGFGLAQIGEFSFIIAQLGTSLHVTSDFIYSIAVAVSLVTTFTTPYLIRISSPAAAWIESRLPDRIRDGLNRYAAQSEARRAGVRSKKNLFRPLLRWFMNGLTTSVIFVFCSEWLFPQVITRLGVNEKVAPFLGWCAAILMSSPFIWAMLTVVWMKESKAPAARVSPSSAIRALSQVLTLLWIGGLSAEFLPGRYVVLTVTVLLIITIVFFYKRLESSYQWFEQRFLSTFEMNPGHSAGPEAPFSHLAPWDVHLVRVEIHANSKFVMKRISDADFRARHGVNIVAIQRGRKAIIPPMPTELLLPKDELILLGTDEQVDNVRKELEGSLEAAEESGSAANYELRQERLSKNSPFAGHTIRKSGIREQYYAMVVGIEREGIRKINPDSDFELREGDVLWIAGERARLDLLMPVLRS